MSRTKDSTTLIIESARKCIILLCSVSFDIFFTFIKLLLCFASFKIVFTKFRFNSWRKRKFCLLDVVFATRDETGSAGFNFYTYTSGSGLIFIPLFRPKVKVLLIDKMKKIKIKTCYSRNECNLSFLKCFKNLTKKCHVKQIQPRLLSSRESASCLLCSVSLDRFFTFISFYYASPVLKVFSLNFVF